MYGVFEAKDKWEDHDRQDHLKMQMNLFFIREKSKDLTLSCAISNTNEDRFFLISSASQRDNERFHYLTSQKIDIDDTTGCKGGHLECRALRNDQPKLKLSQLTTVPD